MNKKMISMDDYPLRTNRSELLFTPNGINIDDITFDNINAEMISGDECRISKESLLMQASIAELCGNNHMASNFERAAEMVDIDSKRIIEIYNALRPYRSTQKELMEMATELREKYSAFKTAEFIEESAEIMKKRNRLKGDR